MLKLAVQCVLAARPIACRSPGSSNRVMAWAAMASRSSTAVMNPVWPSTTMVRAPGTSVAMTGSPDMPASMRTPGMPSPAGRLGKTMRSDRRMRSAMSDRDPSSSTPASVAAPAILSRIGPSPASNDRHRTPLARSIAVSSMKTSGRLPAVRAPTNRRVGSARSGAAGSGWNTSGSRPFGVTVIRAAGTPRRSMHCSRTSSPSAAITSALATRRLHSSSWARPPEPE